MGLPVAIGFGLVLLLAMSEEEGHASAPAGGAEVITSGMAPAEFLPLIRQAAADCEAGLSPVLLAAQLEHESAGWDPEVISGARLSPAGAQGIAQFMPGTWETWGHGGDPFDPADAIPAQGRFMCHLVKQAQANPKYSGSVAELALAGYNAGWGAVERYRGVPPETFAEGETYNYVRIILANVAKLGAGSDDGVWQAPVEAPLGAQYRQQSALWASGYHTGVDFTAPAGTPITAAAAGTVVTAHNSGASYGLEIVIDHGDGIYSQYAHLSALAVREGQAVAVGEELGLVGSTGNSTGPHLHFEIRTGPGYGSDIDPIVYLRDRGVQI